ncbi:peptidoglycan-binding domain-containing protein [Nioella nitratireducens]|uniref:peptidoglycan-binding domain-containing protein n=1 Tax=Nioella nitratireducens TaxID=1287720 RepID=UPI0008FD6112|nr:peptidoglycan-binding domain-containing protein [Nioella nitratireducens]
MVTRWAIGLAILLAAATTDAAEAQEARLSDVLLVAEHGSQSDRSLTRWVQRHLQGYGYYAGAIDGIWGPQTDTAVQLALRAAQPHVFNVVEDPAGTGRVQLLPVAPGSTPGQLGLGPVDARITVPHMPAVVPSAYARRPDMGALVHDLIPRRDAAQRYDTLFVDRADGYRIIVEREVVEVIRH